MVNPALTGFTTSKSLWVRNHQPESCAKCRHILLPKGYMHYMLTGDYATDVFHASGMQGTVKSYAQNRLADSG